MTEQGKKARQKVIEAIRALDEAEEILQADLNIQDVYDHLHYILDKFEEEAEK